VNPDWELSAIVDADGRIDRPLAQATWATAGSHELADGGLQAIGQPIHEVHADEELLARFVELVGRDDQALVTFADRYGLLGLCEHELPASHNPMPYGFQSGVATWCNSIETESTAIWRTFSGQARAMVNVAAAVRAGRPGAERDWAEIYARSGRNAPWWKQSADVDASNLAHVVNEWLQLGNVRPALAGRELRMITSGGLFGALAVRLAAAVATAPTVYLCDGCGNPVDLSSRDRKPQTGRRVFCDACQATGVPNRIRAQEARARKRGSR
jgi:hypothetical protein